MLRMLYTAVWPSAGKLWAVCQK